MPGAGQVLDGRRIGSIKGWRGKIGLEAWEEILGVQECKVRGGRKDEKVACELLLGSLIWKEVELGPFGRNGP
ncbi:hypothetical protein NPIL_81681 [Nephila pilipes]|uniref:Uncharacterized protein n=1 Tax=Nephila pilipes TaxID=299642 RepID=A0A8X6UQ53_NEPPI|nr:hypothetical protein NPIL_81681 [Nephila pilipes]